MYGEKYCNACVPVVVRQWLRCGDAHHSAAWIKGSSMVRMSTTETLYDVQKSCQAFAISMKAPVMLADASEGR